MRRHVLRALVPCVAVGLTACASMSNMKFWEQGYEFQAGTLPVAELRRALVCDTPTEDADVTLFDAGDALRSSPLGSSLEAGSLDLVPSSSYLVVEQGQRRTGGYSIEMLPEATLTDEGVLKLTGTWLEPGADRMTIQILTSVCVLLEVPAQPYNLSLIHI